MSKRRILIALPDLHGGGSQRVVLTLLRHLSHDRFELHLAVLDRTGRFASSVPRDVSIHDLQTGSVRRSGRALVRLARELRPHVIFSTLYHLNHFLLLLRPFLPRGTRLIVREGTVAGTALRTRRMQWAWSLMFRTLYRSADQIICQCDYMKRDLHESFRVPLEKMTTIYNPLEVDEVRELAAVGRSPFSAAGLGPHVLAAGRLAPVKGFDRLIRLLPELAAAYPSAQLWILGDEAVPGRIIAQELRELAESLEVADRLHLVGFQENPYVWLAHADLFVLSSHYEGLPNILLEAMACGCPVLALDNPGGTREIMEHTGQMARLVDQIEWRPEWFRSGSSEEDRVADLSAFSLERAVQAYEAVFASD